MRYNYETSSDEVSSYKQQITYVSSTNGSIKWKRNVITNKLNMLVPQTVGNTSIVNESPAISN